MTKATAGPRPDVSLPALVDASIGLIEAHGLAVFSMRRLAGLFGLQAASLYWYFPNKEVLLDHAAERLLELAADHIIERLATQRQLTVDEHLLLAGVAYEGFLRPRCDAIRILTSRLPAGPALARFLDVFGDRLIAARMDPELAADVVMAVIGYVHGAVLAQFAHLVIPSRGLEVSRHNFALRLEAMPESEPGTSFTVAAAAHIAGCPPTRFTAGLSAIVDRLTL